MRRPTRIAGNADFLNEVAAIYREALARGDNPTATIALIGEVDARTAERWVSLARDIGALGPARHGMAGEFT